jgi:hypothetical protein
MVLPPTRSREGLLAISSSLVIGEPGKTRKTMSRPVAVSLHYRVRARADGCSVDETPTPPSQTAADEPALASPESDLTRTPASGCSFVQWCNDPNSSNGTVCRQQVCDLAPAKNECTKGSSTVCGTPSTRGHSSARSGSLRAHGRVRVRAVLRWALLQSQRHGLRGRRGLL